MADQTAIDVYERGNYSEDHRKHRDSDADAPSDRQSTTMSFSYVKPLPVGKAFDGFVGRCGDGRKRLGPDAV